MPDTESLSLPGATFSWPRLQLLRLQTADANGYNTEEIKRLRERRHRVRRETCRTQRTSDLRARLSRRRHRVRDDPWLPDNSRIDRDVAAPLLCAAGRRVIAFDFLGFSASQGAAWSNGR